MSKGALKTRDIKQSFKDFLFGKTVKIFIMARIGEVVDLPKDEKPKTRDETKDAGGVFKIIMSGKARPTTRTFTKRGFTYVIMPERAILDRDNSPTLFYLLNRAIPLSFARNLKQYKRTIKLPDGTTIEGILDFDPKTLTAVLRTKKMAEKLGGAFDYNIYWLIIAGLSVGIVGITLYSVYMQNELMQQILSLRKLLGVTI